MGRWLPHPEAGLFWVSYLMMESQEGKERTEDPQEPQSLSQGESKFPVLHVWCSGEDWRQIRTPESQKLRALAPFLAPPLGKAPLPRVLTFGLVCNFGKLPLSNIPPQASENSSQFQCTEWKQHGIQSWKNLDSSLHAPLCLGVKTLGRACFWRHCV